MNYAEAEIPFTRIHEPKHLHVEREVFTLPKTLLIKEYSLKNNDDPYYPISDEANKAILAKYQDKFRYILVDEYQDTNHSQYLIVRALSDRFQNICVVGDDAQSIYAFRGANINNILNFQRDYDDVKVFRLEQNYRSTKNIVNAANSIIDKNETKLEKVVWTANEEGKKIKVNRSSSLNRL
jgi:superfamily I DNA/RNA helicase